MPHATHCPSCGQEYAADALFCPACGTPRSQGASGDPLMGTVLGQRFLILERLGHGASGTIYRGEHVTLRRKVAIKVLHQELSRDELAVERFRREATTVSEIDNEHIVEIFDFGRTPDGRLYLAMELLEGETLQDRLKREKRLPVDQAVDILIQLGEALMEAHAMGYIHRDLRPRNIYLARRRGRDHFVKLLDFGLAKLVENEGEAESTSLGMTFGDPRYMSPEQARGETLDRRADIYSLGCIAYEMLVGQAPFARGKIFDILTQQVDATPAEPRARRDDVPAWLSNAIMCMLAKRPDDRFITVYRLVEALRQGTRTGESMSAEMARQRESTPPPMASSTSRAAQRMTEPDTVRQSAGETAREPAGRDDHAEPESPMRWRNTDVGLGAPVTIKTHAPVPVHADPGPDSDVSRDGDDGDDTRDDTRDDDGGDDRDFRDDRDLRGDRDGGDDDDGDDPTGGDDDDDDLAGGDEAKTQPVAATSPRAARGKPAEDSMSGLSGAWFAEREHGDDLDDGDRARLQQARSSITAGDSTAGDDLYYDPSRKPLAKIAAVAGGVLVLIIVIIAVAWPSGKSSDKKGSDSPPGTPTADDVMARMAADQAAAQPDAGTADAGARDDGSDGGAGNPAGDTAGGHTGSAADTGKTTGKTTADGKDRDRDRGSSTSGKSGKSGKDRTSRTGTGDRGGSSDPADELRDPFMDPLGRDEDRGGSGGSQDAKQAAFFAKLGERDLRNGDIQGALGNFKKALDLDPKNAEAIMGQGEIALRTGSYAAAIKQLKKAARMRPGSAHVHTLLGEAYLSTGKDSDAASSFKRALKLDPDNARARDGYNEAAGKIPPPPEDEPEDEDDEADGAE